MFSFKFRPDKQANEYHVICDNDFKRLDHCMAYVQARAKISTDNALHHTILHETFVLWSYSTCILIVTVLTDETDCKIRINVSVNEESWNCSRSTIGHVSRFLRRLTSFYKLGYGLTYHHLKQVMNSTRMHFFYDCPDWLEYHGYDNYDIDVPLTWHRYNDEEMSKRLDVMRLARPIVKRV